MTFGPPPIPLTTVMGRVLRCTRCSKLVDLVEIPRADVNPDEYVCLDHFEPLRSPGQFRTSGFATSNEAPKTEAPTPPPRPLRDQIREYVDQAFGDAA